MNARAPGMAFDEQLGELTMREKALLTPRNGGSRKTVQHGEDVGRVDGAPKGSFDIPLQALGLWPGPFHSPFGVAAPFPLRNES